MHGVRWGRGVVLVVVCVPKGGIPLYIGAQFYQVGLGHAWFYVIATCVQFAPHGNTFSRGRGVAKAQPRNSHAICPPSPVDSASRLRRKLDIWLWGNAPPHACSWQDVFSYCMELCRQLDASNMLCSCQMHQPMVLLSIASQEADAEEHGSRFQPSGQLLQIGSFNSYKA